MGQLRNTHLCQESVSIWIRFWYVIHTKRQFTEQYLDQCCMLYCYSSFQCTKSGKEVFKFMSSPPLLLYTKQYNLGLHLLNLTFLTEDIHLPQLSYIFNENLHLSWIPTGSTLCWNLEPDLGAINHNLVSIFDKKKRSCLCFSTGEVSFFTKIICIFLHIFTVELSVLNCLWFCRYMGEKENNYFFL